MGHPLEYLDDDVAPLARNKEKDGEGMVKV